MFVVFVIPIFWPFLILWLGDRRKWTGILFHRVTKTQPQRFFVWGWRVNVRGVFQAMLTPETMPWDRTLDTEPRYIRIRQKSGAFVGGYFGGVHRYPQQSDRNGEENYGIQY
jgi:hypothetical protein